MPRFTDFPGLCVLDFETSSCRASSDCFSRFLDFWMYQPYNPEKLKPKTSGNLEICQSRNAEIGNLEI